jgi:hypothetical protein
MTTHSLFSLMPQKQSWHGPIQKLLRFWSQLEKRTHQTMELLKAAAEQRCGFDVADTVSDSKPSKAVRKARERRKKALATVEDLLARSNTSEEKDVLHSIFEPLCELLEQRSVMREQWSKREHDHAFRELGPECRPLNVPLRFNADDSTKQADECGSSPMKGSPAELKQIIEDLRDYGKAFQSKKLQDLPSTATTNMNSSSNATEETEHLKSLEWSGWSQNDFGLELQEPWAAAVIEGRKLIETRSYNLPPSLVGKRVVIIQSPAGKPGVSGMGNIIDLSRQNSTGARVIGWCIFDSVKKYTTKEDFEADEKDHLVTPDSGYGWKKGETKLLYGWVVGQHGTFKMEETQFLSATRRMRSLFQLRLKDSSTVGKANQASTVGKANQAKKKKSNVNSDSNQKKKRRKRF